ncbi:hypothetical protein BHM03_00038754 [Ensete ventricosum]|nr:hypothetical protein BHM03_00038754 [Ensete ventricosum]
MGAGQIVTPCTGIPSRPPMSSQDSTFRLNSARRRCSPGDDRTKYDRICRWIMDGDFDDLARRNASQPLELAFIIVKRLLKRKIASRHFHG